MRFLETQSEQAPTDDLHKHFVTAREALLPSAPWPKVHTTSWQCPAVQGLLLTHRPSVIGLVTASPNLIRTKHFADLHSRGKLGVTVLCRPFQNLLPRTQNTLFLGLLRKKFRGIYEEVVRVAPNYQDHQRFRRHPKTNCVTVLASSYFSLLVSVA